MSHHSGPELTESVLLNMIASVLSRYIEETDPKVLFNGLLEALLQLTGSEYGFIAEVSRNEDGSPCLRAKAVTDISWDEDTYRVYKEAEVQGMVFSRIDSLYGAILDTGQVVITNAPAHDPRASGIPAGHPALNSFMGVPFSAGGEMQAVVGLANRRDGYDQALAAILKPFLVTCGNLILAYRNNVRHSQVAYELEQYRALLDENKSIELGDGYRFDAEASTLTCRGKVVSLTNKELLLLECLLSNRGKLVKREVIEECVWKDVVVGDTSLRVLIMRLRKKIPVLSIQTIPGVGYILS